MLKRCLVIALVGWTALPVAAQRSGCPPEPRGRDGRRRKDLADIPRPSAERTRSQVLGHYGNAADPPGRWQDRRAYVFRGVYEGRRGREDASRVLSVQRRPRVADGLAAHGIVRAPARPDGRGWGPARST